MSYENYGIKNPLLREQVNLSQGQSGMNLYNRMVQSGSRRVATNRDQLIQQATELGIRNPAMLTQLFGEIAQRTGDQFANLESTAGIAGEEFAQKERDRLTNIGMSLEQMQRNEDFQMKMQKRQELVGLISAVAGGGLSLAGGLIQGGATKAASKGMAEATVEAAKVGSKGINVTETLKGIFGIMNNPTGGASAEPSYKQMEGYDTPSLTLPMQIEGPVPYEGGIGPTTNYNPQFSPLNMNEMGFPPGFLQQLQQFMNQGNRMTMGTGGY